MRALIGQIRWRSILQYSVLAEMGASRLSTSTVRALVTLLQGPFSDRWHERLVALWALGCADLAPNHRSAVTEAVQAALIQDHSRPDLTLVDRGASAWRRTRPLAGLAGVGVFLWTLSLLLPSAEGGGFRILPLLASVLASGVLGSVASILASYLIFPAVLPISYALDSARNQRVRAAAALALGRMGRRESIGVLARAALDLSPAVRQGAETALRALLPTLTPDDYGHLDAQTCPSLCRLLNVRRQQLFADHIRTEDLVVDLLAALGKVGDGRALPLVQEIADDGWTERARQAAQGILPFLQDRKRHEQDHRLLLRGAAAPTASDELLLHAVTRAAAFEPETLLRSSADTAR